MPPNADDVWARAQRANGGHGKIMGHPGFKYAAAQMFSLLDQNGNPPQKLALRPPQLAYLLMWVSVSHSAVCSKSHPGSFALETVALAHLRRDVCMWQPA